MCALHSLLWAGCNTSSVIVNQNLMSSTPSLLKQQVSWKKVSSLPVNDYMRRQGLFLVKFFSYTSKISVFLYSNSCKKTVWLTELEIHFSNRSSRGLPRVFDKTQIWSFARATWVQTKSNKKSRTNLLMLPSQDMPKLRNATHCMLRECENLTS